MSRLLDKFFCVDLAYQTYRELIKFYDYEIDQFNRKNRKIVFSASITAGKLIDLFNQLHKRLQESYDTFDIYENKTMMFNDMRKDKNISKERAEDFLNFFKSKGFALVKQKIHSK